MNEVTTVIIGGVQRVINQVGSYDEYHGIKKGDTVGDILEKSRASRLAQKELEKYYGGVEMAIAVGELVPNVLIDLPSINWHTEKFGEVREAGRKASKLERNYAKQASRIYSRD